MQDLGVDHATLLLIGHEDNRSKWMAATKDFSWPKQIQYIEMNFESAVLPKALCSVDGINHPVTFYHILVLLPTSEIWRPNATKVVKELINSTTGVARRLSIVHIGSSQSRDETSWLQKRGSNFNQSVGHGSIRHFLIIEDTDRWDYAVDSEESHADAGVPRRLEQLSSLSFYIFEAAKVPIKLIGHNLNLPLTTTSGRLALIELQHYCEQKSSQDIGHVLVMNHLRDTIISLKTSLTELEEDLMKKSAPIVQRIEIEWYPGCGGSFCWGFMTFPFVTNPFVLKYSERLPNSLKSMTSYQISNANDGSGVNVTNVRYDRLMQTLHFTVSSLPFQNSIVTIDVHGIPAVSERQEQIILDLRGQIREKARKLQEAESELTRLTELESSLASERGAVSSIRNLLHASVFPLPVINILSDTTTSAEQKFHLLLKSRID